MRAMQVDQRVASLRHVLLANAVKEKSLKFRSWGHRGLAVAKSAPPALDASRAIETGSGERILGQESAQGLDCRARKIGLVRVTRRCSIGMPDRPKRHEYVFVFS